MRALKAFLLAPIPSILLFVFVTFLPSLISGSFIGGLQTLRAQLIFVLSFGVIISYAAIIILGAPAFIVLRMIKVESALLTICIAATIGALVIISPEVYRVASISAGSTHSFRTGSCESIVDNVRTACGYANLLQNAGYFAGLGALAGATFWYVYTNTDKFSLRWIAGAFASLAILFGAAVYATADRSCHNLLRDGRTSIGPTAMLELIAPSSDHEKIGVTLTQFAAKENLSIRDERVPGRSVDFSLCNAHGISIKTSTRAFKDDGVVAYLYLTDETADWEALWDRLEIALFEWRALKD